MTTDVLDLARRIVEAANHPPMADGPVDTPKRHDELQKCAARRRFLADASLYTVELAAALLAAREEALGEAAKIIDKRAALHHRERQGETQVALHRGYEIAEETAEECAAAIRALKAPPKDTP